MAKNTQTTTSTAKPSTAKPTVSSRTSKSGGGKTSATVKEAKGDIATSGQTSKSTSKGN